jgi:hypothetical protein
MRQLALLPQRPIKGRFRRNVPAFIGQSWHDLLGGQVSILWRVGDRQDFLSLCRCQFVGRCGQRATTTIAAIHMVGPPLNGTGGQPKHLSGRLQSGSPANGFIDKFESLLPL